MYKCELIYYFASGDQHVSSGTLDKVMEEYEEWLEIKDKGRAKIVQLYVKGHPQGIDLSMAYKAQIHPLE